MKVLLPIDAKPTWPLLPEASPGPLEGPGSGGPAGAGMWSRLPEGLVFQEKRQVWIWRWQPLISQNWKSSHHAQPSLWGTFLQVPTVLTAELSRPSITTLRAVPYSPPYLLGISFTLSPPKLVGQVPGGPESKEHPSTPPASSHICWDTRRGSHTLCHQHPPWTG